MHARDRSWNDLCALQLCKPPVPCIQQLQALSKRMVMVPGHRADATLKFKGSFQASCRLERESVRIEFEVDSASGLVEYDFADKKLLRAYEVKNGSSVVSIVAARWSLYTQMRFSVQKDSGTADNSALFHVNENHFQRVHWAKRYI